MFMIETCSMFNLLLYHPFERVRRSVLRGEQTLNEPSAELAP
jgi:hypothetical protein